MFLNFDKVMAALIICVTSGLYTSEQHITIKTLQQTALYLTLCICVVMIPAYCSGYIKIDLKWPSIFWIWVCNNFFFVCAGEEIIFRGFLQNKLKSWFVSYTCGRYLHIIIASMVFGLSHFRDGWTYIALASICGLFYGYTYDKTNRILCAVIVHFGLNFVHLMMFTYPSFLPVLR